MNSPRDPWQDFCEVFAPELRAANQWTEEQMQAAADEYQREQIASAQSDEAWAANLKEYSK